jgi:hypothetical protein
VWRLLSPWFGSFDSLTRTGNDGSGLFYSWDSLENPQDQNFHSRHVILVQPQQNLSRNPIRKFSAKMSKTFFASFFSSHLLIKSQHMLTSMFLILDPSISIGMHSMKSEIDFPTAQLSQTLRLSLSSAKRFMRKVADVIARRL